MLTQIEFYDKDVIKNTLGVISVKPDKIVFVYDDAITDMNRFKSLEKCFKRHLPNAVLEKYPVDILKIDKRMLAACDNDKDIKIIKIQY